MKVTSSHQVQVKARHVVERYIAKTHPMVLFNSTPNLPGGLMDTMIHEVDSIYDVILLHYKLGLEAGIYHPFEIQEAMRSPSFPREYELVFGIGIGNIFNNKLLDRCIKSYALAPQGGIRVLCCDPAFGESETASYYGIGGYEKRSDGKIYVVHAEQRKRPSPGDMMNYIHEVFWRGKYHVLRVDAAWSGIIRDFQSPSGQSQRKSINTEAVTFSDRLEGMTTAASLAVDHDLVRIDPSLSILINQLKAIEYKKDKSVPDKSKMSFDVGDTFLMGVDYWEGQTFGGKLFKKEF